ncbi:BTAD domain-containing putative transcriptional regulator [Nocardia sp. NPDC050710]|uniref:AfsR/SARP family transcriptional regulator n=1 Tax=Nocardia sp. NPDC050710 TaxID=3157220 RepID=UPI0033C1EBC3
MRTQPIVQFRLLGMFEAYVGDTPVSLGGRRERRLLVALLSEAGKPIPRGKLIEWVWDDSPKKPDPSLNEIVSIVRTKYLRPLGLDRKLRHLDGTYRLDVPPEWVDVHVFRMLTDRAAQVDDDQAREFLSSAVQLIHGKPLMGMEGRRIDGYRAQLTNACRSAELRLNQIEVEQGHALERIPSLQRLHAEIPHDTQGAELYMTALHLVGRTAEALRCYGRVHGLLIRLGLVIPDEFTALQERFLREGPRLGHQSIDEATMAPDDHTEDQHDDPKPTADNHDPVTNVFTYVEQVHSRNVVFGVQQRPS